MGSSSSKDVVEEARQQKLDVSHQLSPLQYKKHTDGECLEGCLLELPWEMCYNTISLYQIVDASFNFIGSIPSELSLHVPHLRHLDLSHNQLTALPPTFQLLLHLRTLYLSHNRFKQFPGVAVFKLPHLHTLDISHNHLKELPQQGWQQLSELERLNLSHNELHLLPNSLALCDRLSVLVVKNNPLMHPPAHVCAEGSSAILGHLRSHLPSPKLPYSTLGSPVFRRVRGDNMSASVNNPESAWRQYQQGSYTGPGNKRKCPLMPPRDAATLPPHKITQALMGLVYGAVAAEAVGLSCEGLTPCETRFYYSTATVAPDTRLRDFLRSHYPAHDWGPMADLMLTTLETVLRWGGVVDELEWAAQAHQWTVQGIPELDDRPGAPISPLLAAVLGSVGYSANPYVAADALNRRLTSELSNASDGVVSDTFTVVRPSRGDAPGEELPPLHPHDNACLPPSLVLGLPSFSQSSEVASNAERICRASHASPCARAAAVLTASLVAAFLRGRFEGKLSNTAAIEEILDDLFRTAVLSMPESLEKATLTKLWTGDLAPREANLPSSHVALTLAYLKQALLRYCAAVFGQDSSLDIERNEVNDNVPYDAGNEDRKYTGSKGVSRMLSDSVLSIASKSETSESAEKTRSRSLVSSPVEIRINDEVASGMSSDVHVLDDVDLHKIDKEKSTMHLLNSYSESPALTASSADAAKVFKNIVSEMCMEGGWGVCAQACVVGGVLGAFGGYDALPTDWLKQFPASNKRYLNARVNFLLDLFGLP